MTEDPSNLNTQAIELANRGSYVEAIACFKRAIVIDKEKNVTSRDVVNKVSKILKINIHLIYLKCL